MAVLNSCCCCIDLKVGCFILAYINLIGTILAILSRIIAMASDKHYYGDTIHVYDGGWVMMGVLVLHLCFVVVLLVGLHQDNPGCVLAFVIEFGCTSVLFIIGGIVVYVLVSLPLFVIILSVTIQLLVSLYFWCVFLSQYQTM